MRSKNRTLWYLQGDCTETREMRETSKMNRRVGRAATQLPPLDIRSSTKSVPITGRNVPHRILLLPQPCLVLRRLLLQERQLFLQRLAHLHIDRVLQRAIWVEYLSVRRCTVRMRVEWPFKWQARAGHDGPSDRPTTQNEARHTRATTYLGQQSLDIPNTLGHRCRFGLLGFRPALTL